MSSADKDGRGRRTKIQYKNGDERRIIAEHISQSLEVYKKYKPGNNTEKRKIYNDLVKELGKKFLRREPSDEEIVKIKNTIQYLKNVSKKKKKQLHGLTIDESAKIWDKIAKFKKEDEHGTMNYAEEMEVPGPPVEPTIFAQISSPAAIFEQSNAFDLMSLNENDDLLASNEFHLQSHHSDSSTTQMMAGYGGSSSSSSCFRQEIPNYLLSGEGQMPWATGSNAIWGDSQLMNASGITTASSSKSSLSSQIPQEIEKTARRPVNKRKKNNDGNSSEDDDDDQQQQNAAANEMQEFVQLLLVDLLNINFGKQSDILQLLGSFSIFSSSASNILKYLKDTASEKFVRLPSSSNSSENQQRTKSPPSMNEKMAECGKIQDKFVRNQIGCPEHGTDHLYVTQIVGKMVRPPRGEYEIRNTGRMIAQNIKSFLGQRFNNLVEEISQEKGQDLSYLTREILVDIHVVEIEFACQHCSLLQYISKCKLTFWFRRCGKMHCNGYFATAEKELPIEFPSVHSAHYDDVIRKFNELPNEEYNLIKNNEHSFYNSFVDKLFQQ